MKAFTKSVVLVHTFIMKVVQEEQVLAYVAIAPCLCCLKNKDGHTACAVLWKPTQIVTSHHYALAFFMVFFDESRNFHRNYYL